MNRARPLLALSVILIALAGCGSGGAVASDNAVTKPPATPPAAATATPTAAPIATPTAPTTTPEASTSAAGELCLPADVLALLNQPDIHKIDSLYRVALANMLFDLPYPEGSVADTTRDYLVPRMLKSIDADLERGWAEAVVSGALLVPACSS